MNWKRIMAVFVCILVVTLPIVIADAYSTGSVSPAPVVAGILIVGVAIVAPALISYFVGAGLASGVVVAVCSDTEEGKSYYEKGTVNVDGDPNTYVDDCTGDVLTEYYCDGEDLGEEDYDCADGCENGACEMGEGVPTGGEVDVIIIKGKDGIEGYRRAINDYYYIEAEAYFDDASKVSSGQVKAKSRGSYKNFDKCEKISEYSYLCKYKSKVNTGYLITDDIIVVDVQLFAMPGDPGTPLDSDRTSIKIDSRAPTVTVVNEPVQDGKNATFRYTIGESAGNSGGSSGIQKARYYHGSQLLGENIINKSQSETDIKLDIHESIEVLTLESGSEEKIKIRIEVTDGVGNEGEGETELFVMDSKAPEVIDGSVYFKDKEGRFLQGIPPNGITGIVMGVVINSSNGLNDIKAMISPLTGSQEEEWKDAASCTSSVTSGIYNCVWRGLTITQYGSMRTVMINASDDLGNQMSQSIGDYNMEIEKDAPKLVSGSLKVVFTGTDKEVNYLGNTSDVGVKGIDIHLNLTDEWPGLGPGGVIVDLSEYGGNAITRANICWETNFVDIWGKLLYKQYNCSFKDLKLDIKGDITKLDFTFIDLYGNQNKHSQSVKIRLDSDEPEIMYLGGSYVDDDGKKWSGPNDELVVRIIEEVSGINETNVKFNLDGEVIEAETCSNVGSEWICTAYVGDDSLTHLEVIELKVDVTDNVGYSVSNETTLTVDAKVPDILELEILSTGYIPDKLTSGEGLSISMKINDTLFVAGLLNLSALNCELEGDIRCSEKKETDGNCEFNSSGLELWNCVWSEDEIYRRYEVGIGDHSKVKFFFNMTDSVGNKLFNESAIYDVYGMVAEVAPDNFDVIVDTGKIFPRKINRLTASLMPESIGIRVNAPFYLKYKKNIKTTTFFGADSNIVVLKQELKDCSICEDCALDDYFYIPRDSCGPGEDCDMVPLARKAVQATTDMNDINYNRGELMLASFDAETANTLQDFNLTCVLYTYQLIGDKIYKEPEKDNVTILLDFVDSALTNAPPQEFGEKINNLREDAMADQDWITKVANFFEVLENICGIGKKVQEVMGVVASIEVVGVALQKFGVTAPVGKVLYAGSCVVYELIGMVYNPIWYGKDGFGKHNFQRCLPKDTPETTDQLKEVKEKGEEVKGTGKSFKDTGASTLKEAITDPELSGRYLCGWIACEYANEFWDKMTGEAFMNSLISGKEGDSEFASKWSDAGKALDSWTGGSISLPTWSTSMSPKNSIIMSMATLCVGGIFYNLNKMRQIQCRYINCMREVAVAGGDTSYCDQKKEESWCLIIMGELYSIFGMGQMWDTFIQGVADMFANAVSLETVIKIGDSLVCGDKGKDILKKAYPAVKTIWCDLTSKIFEIVDSTQRMAGIGKYGGQSYWSISSTIPDECPQAMCDGEWTGGNCKCTVDEECFGGDCVDGVCDW